MSLSIVRFNSLPIALANVRISDRHGENPDYPPFRLVGDKETPLYTFEGSVKSGKDRYVNFQFNVWNEQAEDLEEQGVIQPGTYIQVSGSISDVQAFELKNNDLGTKIIVDVDRLVPPYNPDGEERPQRGGGSRRSGAGSRRGAGGKSRTRSSGGASGQRRTGNRTSGAKSKSGSSGAGRYGAKSKPAADDDDDEEEDDE